MGRAEAVMISPSPNNQNNSHIFMYIIRLQNESGTSYNLNGSIQICGIALAVNSYNGCIFYICEHILKQKRP